MLWFFRFLISIKRKSKNMYGFVHLQQIDEYSLEKSYKEKIHVLLLIWTNMRQCTFVGIRRFLVTTEQTTLKVWSNFILSTEREKSVSTQQYLDGGHLEATAFQSSPKFSFPFQRERKTREFFLFFLEHSFSSIKL